MRRWILALLALVVLAGLLWRSLSEHRPSAPRGSPAGEARAVPAVVAVEPGLPAAAEQRVPVETEAVAQTATTVVAEAAPAPPPERPDLEARDWLEIQVLDPEGRPVAEAQLEIGGLRKEGDAGSWYGMRDGPTTAHTDEQGRARIDYVRWVDIDGRTRKVDLRVTHAEFVPFRDSSFPIGPGQHPVMLRRGATVVVSAWSGTPERWITDVRIQVDARSRLASDAWVREKDGRLATTRLAPGVHFLWLTHESAEHGMLASAIERFELGEGEWKELHVELRPLLTLAGRLDDSVPRPIEDGRVWINLHAGGHPEPSIDRDFEAPVRPDGSFELTGLPPGRGQLIALCRGSVSRCTRVETAAEAGIHFGSEPTPAQLAQALEDAGERAFQAQRIAVPSSGPVVVEMEPTGTLAVTVRGPDGAPLAGALVSAWPNVYWIGVGSTIFPGRDWLATTDAAGRAWIEDLPAEGELWFGIEHASFQMTRAQRDDSPRARILSGLTAEVEVALERKEE